MTGRDWDMRGTRLSAFQFAERLVNDGVPRMALDRGENNPVWAAAEGFGWVKTVRPTKNAGCQPPYRTHPWPKVTGEGYSEVERVRSLRNNSQRRAQACREALLLWLSYGGGRGAGSAELMATRDDWRFFDDPFTVAEVHEAARFLKETGLVDGWLYPGETATFMTPALTAAGTQCVEYHDADVRTFLSPAPPRPVPPRANVTHNEQHFHRDVNGQVAQGQNVTQTQNNGVDAEALAPIFGVMRAALSTVDDQHDRDDFAHAVRELELAVNRGNSAEVAASADRLQRLVAHVGATVSNPADDAASEGVEQMLRELGLG